MPSGPKKRLRAKRKKQGSPATDANSDRETEALSVSGSVDVDDLESGVDTPSKATSRPTFLDRDALSSQTDEWIRVSDFDVGTPTSQIEENDPSAEDGDTGSSRISMDKLAEWETVTRENIPFRQEGSVNSPEDEPSECEAASVHSSESFTKLPSPHPAVRDKDGDIIDSDGTNRIADRSNYSSNSGGKGASAFAENFDLSASTDIGEEASSASLLPSVSAPGEGQVEVIDTDDQDKILGTSGLCGPGSTEAKSLEESREQGTEEVPPGSFQSTLAETNADERDTVSANTINTREVEAPLNITAFSEETPNEKRSLPVGEKNAVVPSPADVQGKDVNVDEKVASSTYDESQAADGKEVASTSADAEEKTKRDAPDSEVATFVEKEPLDPQDFTADSFSVKVAPTSATSQYVALSEERHLSVSTSVDKNGTEKPRIEAKSLTGCCGVLYWLLGWDQ